VLLATLVRRIAGHIDLHQGSASFSFRRRPRAFMRKRFLTEGKLRYESGRMGDAAPRRLRWHRLHGVSSELKGGINGRLIRNRSCLRAAFLLGTPRLAAVFFGAASSAMSGFGNKAGYCVRGR
jgi:hypothetical protein